MLQSKANDCLPHDLFGAKLEDYGDDEKWLHLILH